MSREWSESDNKEAPHNRMYTPDQKGFYPKYRVVDNKGTPIEGPFFVLRIYDPHARAAMVAYAGSISAENPQLAEDLLTLVMTYDRDHDVTLTPEA